MPDFDDEERFEGLSAIPDEAETLQDFRESDDFELLTSTSALEGDASSKGIKRGVSQEEMDGCYQKIEEELESWVLGDLNEDVPELLVKPDLGLESPGLVDRGEYLRASRKRPVLGIDIGETSVKLVHVDTGQKILAMDTEPLEATQDTEKREQAITQAIQLMIERNKIKTRQAVLCVSEKCTYIRLAEFPKLDKDELQNALALEAAKLQTKSEIENSLFNYIVLDESNGADKKTMTVLVFSTDRRIIMRTLRNAKAAGIKPIAIDIDALASTRFYRQCYITSESDTTVLAEMHAGNTLLSFVEKDRLVWAKHISTGSQEFTESIAKALRIDSSEAEDLKRGEWKKGNKSLQGRQSEARRAVEPVLDRLAGDMRRAVQYFLSQASERRIDFLVLGGAGSRIAGLDKDLARLLDLPVVRWGKTSRFRFSSVIPDDNSVSDALARHALSLGLCLWNKGADSINLLPGPWQRFGTRMSDNRRSASGFTKVTRWMPRLKMGRTVSLAVAALVLLILGSGKIIYTKNQDLKIRLGEEQQKLQDWSSVREDVARFRGLRKEVAGKRDLINGIRAQQFRLANATGEFSESVPRSISLASIDFENGGFSVKGYTLDTKSLQDLISGLKRSTHFTDPELGVIKKSVTSEGERIYFELAFGLKRP